MTAFRDWTGGRALFLWAMLVLYAAARISQLYAGRLPVLAIVILHVIPPALFALAHGATLYRANGIAVFALCCLGVGTLAESLSLRTGFPFGSYFFTDVMGPKLAQLPVLLALAYLGIGYVAWNLALLIAGDAGKPIRGARVFAVPLLAGVIMTSWDLSMDPVWSLVDGAWVWQGGGPYFGVPVSNYCGWLLTAYVYYQAFAFYCRARPIAPPAARRGSWLMPVYFYLVCALGNLLILKQPMAPPVVSDSAGRQWLTADILRACILVSLLVMTPLALFAWYRAPRQGRRIFS